MKTRPIFWWCLGGAVLFAYVWQQYVDPPHSIWKSGHPPTASEQRARDAIIEAQKTPEDRAADAKEIAAKDRRVNARMYCVLAQNSPEYRVSSAGGDYRREVDEACDELRRRSLR